MGGRGAVHVLYQKLFNYPKIPWNCRAAWDLNIDMSVLALASGRASLARQLLGPHWRPSQCAHARAARRGLAQDAHARGLQAPPGHRLIRPWPWRLTACYL